MYDVRWFVKNTMISAKCRDLRQITERIVNPYPTDSMHVQFIEHSHGCFKDIQIVLMKLSLCVIQYYDMSLFPAFTIVERQLRNYHAINMNSLTATFAQKCLRSKMYPKIMFWFIYFMSRFFVIMDIDMECKKKRKRIPALLFYMYLVVLCKLYWFIPDDFHISVPSYPIACAIARSRWISSDISSPSFSAFVPLVRDARQVRRQIYGFSWQ